MGAYATPDPVPTGSEHTASPDDRRVDRVAIAVVPVAVAIGLMVWLCVSRDLMEVAFLVVGLWVGALLRDLRYAFEVQRGWPCIERMFDWAKIEEMAGEE